MEQWVKAWVEEQRDQGVKCLEVKMRGKMYYVYHSSTYWDKALKKPRKISKYLGALDPDKGLIKSGGRHRIYPSDIRNITEYGNSMLLHETIKDLKPLLKKGFPDCWAEICAIAMVRVTSNVPLKRIKDAWEKLYNAEYTNPYLSPKKLSRIIHEVGVNRAGQNIIFNELADLSKQLVYDLSSVFSRSMSINQAEKGYNKDKIQVPQINLALLCSADTGLPTMIHSLPGSVKDIKSLYHSINELDIEGKILIVSDMDVEKLEIYLLYKKREVVEKMFDTYKTVLNADKLYLQDDESVFGHVFIAFLSLYIHCKLEQLLKKAELNHKFTPIDLLFKYSKVYHVNLKDHSMITEVPKKVRDLEEKLGLNIFPN